MADPEVEIDGRLYRIGRLTPRKAIHIARRLSPFLGAIIPHLKELFSPKNGGAPTADDFFNRAAAVAPALAEIISELEDEDVDYILDNCLAAVYLKQEHVLWAPIVSHGVVMFQDLDARTQIELAVEVIKANLSSFMRSSQPRESEEAVAR